jgi:hypothetical protein
MMLHVDREYRRQPDLSLVRTSKLDSNTAEITKGKVRIE